MHGFRLSCWLGHALPPPPPVPPHLRHVPAKQQQLRPLLDGQQRGSFPVTWHVRGAAQAVVRYGQQRGQLKEHVHVLGALVPQCQLLQEGSLPLQGVVLGVELLRQLGKFCALKEG